LFSAKLRRRPGPKGPNKELIAAVVEMKRRNPNWGCPRIAQQITLAFGVDIDKDVVRRILSVHYRPDSDSGPSWLTFLGHVKDSLWSCDLFRCESATLRTHWVLVVMDEFTRRLIGLASTMALAVVAGARRGASGAGFSGASGSQIEKDLTGLFRVPAGASGFGVLPLDEDARVMTGALEQSNVDPSEVLVEMVEAQRLYDMRTKLVAQAKELDEGGAQLMKIT